MKSIAIASSLLLVASAAVADPAEAPIPPEEPQTLLGHGLLRSGWYVAPASGATTVRGDLAYTPGLRGAWLVERNLGFGLAVHESIDLNDGCQRAHRFFALEPTANVEVNVAWFARLAMGVGYRVALAEPGSPLSNSELGGIVVRSSFELGRFR